MCLVQNEKIKWLETRNALIGDNHQSLVHKTTTTLLIRTSRMERVAETENTNDWKIKGKISRFNESKGNIAESQKLK